MSGSIPRMRALPAIVALTTLVYLSEFLLSPGTQRWLVAFFGLSPQGIERGRLWQFVTYAFLHGGLIHLLANMAGLWFAGRIVERVMGTWRFVALYVSAAIAGGVAQVLLADSQAILLGASGAVCGVLLAFTTMFPDVNRVALFFFVLPVPMRVKYLGWILVGSSLIFLLLNFEPWISHAAHLGGAVAGYLYARLCGYGVPTLPERLVFRKSPPES